MLNQEQVIAILEEAGVLQRGHFRLTSGKHSGVYLQCARLLQYPDKAGPISAALADAFREQKIDVVIGPATGAIILAYEVARALGVRALFMERENGIMTLRRGLTITPGERVLAVEDVVTTGGSVQEVVDEVERLGGIPVGIGSIVDRSGGKSSFKFPFKALVSLAAENYEPQDCPLCQQRIPIVKPGSRQI